MNNDTIFGKLQTLAFKGFVIIVFLFLAFPLFILIFSAFSQNWFINIHSLSLSLRWIINVFKPDWIKAILTSMIIGTIVSILSALLGLLASLAVERYSFFGKSLINVLLISPIMIPNIIIGVALLLYFYYLNFEQFLGLPALIIGHTVITLPYSIRSISISLKRYSKDLELVAQDLGANRINTFLHITFPLIKTGIFAGMVFSYIMSFNNISISIFLSRAHSIPVSIKIMNYLEYSFEPLIAAVSLITSLFSLIIIIYTEKYFKLSKLLIIEEE